MATPGGAWEDLLLDQQAILKFLQETGKDFHCEECPKVGMCFGCWMKYRDSIGRDF